MVTTPGYSDDECPHCGLPWTYLEGRKLCPEEFWRAVRAADPDERAWLLTAPFGRAEGGADTSESRGVGSDPGFLRWLRAHVARLSESNRQIAAVAGVDEGTVRNQLRNIPHLERPDRTARVHAVERPATADGKEAQLERDAKRSRLARLARRRAKAGPLARR